MHLIIGAGVGGEGIAKYLGSGYYFADDNSAKAHFPSPDEVPWESISSVIVSAGIPPHSPWLKRAEELGKAIVGEAQFALERLSQTRMVAVTGTNGKTTLTLFAEHVLRSLGYEAKACGNVGLSLGAFLCAPAPIAVVELSSYQLARLNVAGFEASVVLNITPDHLDWHGSIKQYAAAKARLHSLTKEGGAFITSQVKETWGDLFPRNARVCGEDLIDAAEALLSPFAISREAIEEAHKSFKRPEHRLEHVATVNGLRFINDSKATNFAALARALATFANNHLVLILSGIPKEESLETVDLSRVHEIIVFGAMSALAPKRAHRVESLEAAVHLAFSLGQEVVLFSPGGSSFDCFENYVDRGRQFKYTVEKIGVSL